MPDVVPDQRAAGAVVPIARPVVEAAAAATVIHARYACVLARAQAPTRERGATSACLIWLCVTATPAGAKHRNEARRTQGTRPQTFVLPPSPRRQGTSFGVGLRAPSPSPRRLPGLVERALALLSLKSPVASRRGIQLATVAGPRRLSTGFPVHDVLSSLSRARRSEPLTQNAVTLVADRSPVKVDAVLCVSHPAAGDSQGAVAGSRGVTYFTGVHQTLRSPTALSAAS